MIDTSMPDTLSVNEKEYEIIELLVKVKVDIPIWQAMENSGMS